jgi:hypothetical protein
MTYQALGHPRRSPPWRGRKPVGRAALEGHAVRYPQPHPAVLSRTLARRLSARLRERPAARVIDTDRPCHAPRARYRRGICRGQVPLRGSSLVLYCICRRDAIGCSSAFIQPLGESVAKAVEEREQDMQVTASGANARREKTSRGQSSRTAREAAGPSRIYRPHRMACARALPLARITGPALLLP